jgi:2-C-methyl-D-erythritol 4-phosphate cytidylyltransferase
MQPRRDVCYAVLPAAGIGARMGGEVPKQYLQVAGATLLEHSLRSLLACARLAAVAVVVHPQDGRADSLPTLTDPRVRRVTGGERRADSVLAGLDALAAEADSGAWVLVHDAARPCLRPADVERLMAVAGAGSAGAILAEPIADTVKLADADGLVVRTLDRTALWRAQTPQMFRLGQLRAALAAALDRGAMVTDEASAMELAGHRIRLVPGPRRNLKVTLPEDLELAGWYLAGAEERGCA